jgi:hypothetical protein
MYSSTLPSTSTLGGGWVVNAHASGRFTPGKDPAANREGPPQFK